MEHDVAHGGGGGEEEAFGAAHQAVVEQEELSEISDLKRRMWKDQMLLSKLEGRAGVFRASSSSSRAPPPAADDEAEEDDDSRDDRDVVRGVQNKRKREMISTTGDNSSGAGGELVAGLVAADENENVNPIDELLKRYYSCVLPDPPHGERFVVAPEDEAGVTTTMPLALGLGELDLCGVVDEVPPDVLFDLIATCSGGADDDVFGLMRED